MRGKDLPYYKFLFRRLQNTGDSEMGVNGSKLSGLVGGDRENGKRIAQSDPQLTPRGYVPVCVGIGSESRRFIVHLTMLRRNADLLDLLCKSAEEYGFCNEGVLRIPYEADDFEEKIARRAKRKIVRV